MAELLRDTSKEGMTGGVLTIGRLVVTASRAARQAVPEAERR
jgi:hypothetical protein